MDSRKFMFVNCWNMSDYESPALWSIHSGGGEAVAIQSTYARLRDSLSVATQKVAIGVVKYVDYEADPVSNGSFYVSSRAGAFHLPATYKRKGFEHERELRALLINIPTKKSDAIDVSDVIDKRAIARTLGHYVPADIHALVERVYVSPTAARWFLDLVGAFADALGFAWLHPVPSALDIPPTF